MKITGCAMDTPTRERASEMFAALAHPARLRIVELLCEGEQTVNNVAGTLGLSQSGTSQHLAVLTRAGLLAMEPHGAARVYRVRGPRIGHILALIAEFCQVHGLYGAPPNEEEAAAEEEMGAPAPPEAGEETDGEAPRTVAHDA